MIYIQNLHKAFGRKKVLEGIGLSFEKGGITAILGPNGSGKTTLIKCMLGMVIPDKGRIEVHGQDTHRQWAYRKEVDYLPQIARFPENLKVRELFRMVQDLRGEAPKAESLIRRFELEPFLDNKLGSLSGGTRQKVNIVQAFMFDSPIMILDEPTSGLDPIAMIGLKELLQEEKARGKTILATTHIMSFVEEMADDVIFLLEGQVYFRGSLGALKEQYQEENLERAIARILKEGKKGFGSNGHSEKSARLVFTAS